MNEAQPTKKPTHGVFHVRDLEGGESFWNRIGSAWPHKDDLGFNIQLDAIPTAFDGRLSLRVVSQKSKVADESESRPVPYEK